MSVIGEIAQLLTAIAAVGAMVLSWRSSLKINKVGRDVEKVHLATNSMKDELVKATAAASRAEGVEAGRNERNS